MHISSEDATSEMVFALLSAGVVLAKVLVPQRRPQGRAEEEGQEAARRLQRKKQRPWIHVNPRCPKFCFSKMNPRWPDFLVQSSSPQPLPSRRRARRSPRPPALHTALSVSPVRPLVAAPSLLIGLSPSHNGPDATSAIFQAELLASLVVGFGWASIKSEGSAQVVQTSCQSLAIPHRRLRKLVRKHGKKNSTR